MKAKRMVALLVLMALAAGVLPGTRMPDVQAEEVTVDETDDDGLIDLDDGDDEDDDEEDLDDGDDIDVIVRIISEWDHHYNAEVDVVNISDEKIDDWEISFDFEDKIENVWNARITEHDEEIDYYTIKNATWNQDIPAGEKVTFGMTVCYGDTKDELKDWYLTRECMEVPEDAYGVSYTEYSRFDDNRVNGQITIKNISDRTIEDWKLDFSSNLIFDEVWGAEVLDNEYACFDNKDSGKDIDPGQSVSFTFLATCDGDTTDVFESILYEMIEIPEDLVGDEDWVEEYEEDEWARYVYERSDFETEEEYQEYLIRHEAIQKGEYVSLKKMQRVQTFALDSQGSTEKPTPGVTPTESPMSTDTPTEPEPPTETQIPAQPEPGQPTAAPSATPVPFVDKPTQTNAPIVLQDGDKKYTIINAGTAAVQTFCQSKSDIYLAQRINEDVVITKIKSKAVTDNNYIIDMKAAGNQKMILRGYNHGQSLEMFRYGNKTYLMVSAGRGYRSYGNSVSFIQFKERKKKGNHILYQYGNGDDERALGAKTLTKTGCANKSRKSNGTPQQVEVALSEDKSTMLVWCQMRTSKTNRKIQLSCYSLKSVMNQFKTVEKKAKKYNKKHPNNKKRIQRQFSTLKKSTCCCSALQTDTKKNVVKPYGSLQALDLSNAKNGTYKIYIGGGNDDKGMQPSIACMSLSTGGKMKYLKRTDVEPIHTAESSMFVTDLMELEGMHYENKKLEFVFVPTTDSKAGKDQQVLFSIDSSRVE